MNHEIQKFIFGVLSRVPVLNWSELELECRKGAFYSKRRQTRKTQDEKIFEPGVHKKLFHAMMNAFAAVRTPETRTVYDVFMDNMRITIDANSGEHVGSIAKKKINSVDYRFLRVAAAIEAKCPGKYNGARAIFQTIHPWKSMCSGVPVQLKQQVVIDQGICADDDPLLGKLTAPEMRWTLQGYSTIDHGKTPPSTVLLESMPGKVGTHFYPQGAYRARVFPRMTKAVSPFAKEKVSNVTLIRKKTRHVFRLKDGIEMHFSKVRQHPFSLVDIEMQPERYEIEFEYMVGPAITSLFTHSKHARIHFIVDKLVPQFQTHVARNIPFAHIHIFEDTEFGKEALQVIMQDGDVACVHKSDYLIGDTEAFTALLHARKSRLISGVTMLCHKEHVVNASSFVEKDDGKFVDVHTMKPVSAVRAVRAARKEKRKRKSFYNIESIRHLGTNTTVYTLKNHFSYIPPFGFQIAERFTEDVKHFFQEEHPFQRLTETR